MNKDTVLILITCLMVSFCSYEKRDKYELPPIEEINSVTQHDFDSILNVEKDNILFLQFWDGMTEEYFNFAVNKLLREKTLKLDTVPKSIPTDWNSSGMYYCNNWITEPYFTFNSTDINVRATIHPEFDSLSNLLMSIRLDLIHNYNGKYDFGSFPDNRFCSVPNACANAIVEIYTFKYGKPLIENRYGTYALGFYRVYLWALNTRVVIAEKLISKSNTDHNKRSIIESFSINYWHSEKLLEMQMRKKSKKLQDSIRHEELKKNTVQNI